MILISNAIAEFFCGSVPLGDPATTTSLQFNVASFYSHAHNG
jgi:hypothetical protein